MQSVSDNFSILKHVKQTKEICDLHNENKIEFRGFVICQSCEKEKSDKRSKEVAINSYQKEKIRRTYGTLKKDSMCSDDTILEATFDNYETSGSETSLAFERARLFADKYKDINEKFNVIITGTPGTGKSHLAMAILKEVNENVDKKMSCLFISTNELMRRIKDSFNNRESKFTEANMIDLLGKADLLVLDDLGSESVFRSKQLNEATEYTQNVIFGILEQRQRTIITTNHSSKELKEIYNSKIVSRSFKNVQVIKFTEATKDKRIGVEF